MQRLLAAFLASSLALTLAPSAEAVRVRVVHRTAVTVRVGVGFPLRRALPAVVVRPPLVAVRVVPRVYLPRVAFAAAVVATAPVAAAIAWHGDEVLARDDEWTDFTFNVDRRGTGLLLDVSRGAAQVSFAEVVFENGETQVIDFDDHVHRVGLYSLLDFRDGRKVDHVRVVARASGDATAIGVRLLG